ncbi:MAG: THUMP domain-containing class I SAM-dependent RNA methyltransferase [Shimia sp.]
MQVLGLFAVVPPGLEPFAEAEAREAGFIARAVPGGVEIEGGWREVWRANLELRCITRLLARVGEFRAMHPAQLDKRARKLDWSGLIAPGTQVRVEAVCRRSKIYHAGAARDRIAGAIRDIAQAEVGEAGAVAIKARIEDDLCTISVDTSGAALHQRGHKEYVGKAPMRETLAAAFLRACEYAPGEPLVDPMCGSGTFVIEAAEITAGLQPGRSRGFAFQALRSFDKGLWAGMQRSGAQADGTFHGQDRDQGSVAGATANAARAGVDASFAQGAVSDLQRPAGPPGLIMVNPPYGARIGNRKALFSLYGALGAVVQERFTGWRIGLVTSDGGLAKATGLKLTAGPPVPHGGLKVKLYQARL